MEPPPISGRTLLTAIFGDPVAHSMSPAMHNAAYAALGMERAYVPMRVAPERLRDAIRAISALGIVGVNLTVPHKERGARMMASLSDEARMLGAINCVVNRDGSLRGDNTDARGLEMDLREAELDLNGRLAVIVGAGGAAAAALLAAMRLGAARIALCNRTPQRAVGLARRFVHVMAAHGLARGAIEPRGLDSLLDRDLVSAARIMINATPMGLKTGGFAEIAYDAAPADCLFYDMVYARDPTPFLAPALARGLRSLDGAGMLANQGVLAFELFNAVAPPAGVMRGALMAALGRPEPPVTRPE
jgi:shikimate dehydrogenase